MYKKRAFTLLEVMIATGLTAMLLAFLMNIYFQCQKMHTNGQNARLVSYQKQFVMARLAKILPATRYLHNKKNSYFFYTEEDPLHSGSSTLTFCFDNGSQYNKVFSCDVLARLYIDKENNLSLAKWTLPKDWTDTTPPALKEILLENVESLHFSFYIPPEKTRPDHLLIPGENLPERTEIVTVWEKNYETIPAIVYLDIKSKTFELNLSYPLCNCPQPIIYNETGE